MPRTGRGRVYRPKGTDVWWLDYSVKGKRYRESSQSTKKGEAEKLLDQRRGEIGLGTFVGPRAERVTLDQVVGHLRADYVKNQRKTWDRAAQSLQHVTDYFGGDARAVNISTGELNKYVMHRLDEDAAPATIRRELAVLSRGFRLAADYGELATVPKIPTVEVNNARSGFLDGADLDAVVAELPEPLRPVVRFAAFTGWRRGEVLSLTWDAVDFELGTIRIDRGKGKTKEPRLFPFAALPPLRAILEDQRERSRQVARETGEICRWVFHREGRPIKDLRHAWASACKRAGVPGMLFHDLRRTAVRNLIRAGVPEKTAMLLVGHKTRSIFDRYNIVNLNDLTAGVEKLAELHGNGSKVAPIRQISKTETA